MQSKLKAELAAARREGLITHWSEIKVAALPETQNAALVYVEATRVSNALPNAQRQADGELLEAALKKGGDAASAAPVLQHQAALVRLAEKASALPGYAMKRDWSQGAQLIAPELATVRQLARLLCLRARLASDAGKPLDALQDIARAARIGGQVATESTLLGTLVQIACLTLANRVFVQVLQRHADRADVLAAARTTLTAFGAPPDPQRALRFELALLRRDLERERKAGVDTQVNQKDLKTFDDGEVIFVRYWRDLNKELSHKGVILLSQRLETIEKRYNSRRDPRWARVGVLAEAFNSLWAKIQQSAVQTLLRQQLLAVLEARQKTGAFPAKPTLPSDPFSGKPLLYRASAQGFVLYSVGENGKDDGGSDEEETIIKDGSKTTRVKDMTVRYEKAAP